MDRQMEKDLNKAAEWVGMRNSGLDLLFAWIGGCTLVLYNNNSYSKRLVLWPWHPTGVNVHTCSCPVVHTYIVYKSQTLSNTWWMCRLHSLPETKPLHK